MFQNSVACSHSNQFSGWARLLPEIDIFPNVPCARALASPLATNNSERSGEMAQRARTFGIVVANLVVSPPATDTCAIQGPVQEAPSMKYKRAPSVTGRL